MNTVFVLFLVVVVTATSAEEARGKVIQDDTKTAEQRADREETTEKSSPQVYTYRPPSQSGIYPNNFYPSNSNPTYNPAYNPSYNPSYNPTYNPGSYYPGVSTGGGVYPITPTVFGSGGATEAFTVRRASSYTKPGTRIIFRDSVTQVGSGWNTARSEFVATSSGLFFFTFSAVSDRYTHFRVSLKHNAQDVVSAYGDATGYQMGSQSAVLRLNAGDRVYLQLDEGRLYDVSSSRAYTTFSGFRIL